MTALERSGGASRDSGMSRGQGRSPRPRPQVPWNNGVERAGVVPAGTMFERTSESDIGQVESSSPSLPTAETSPPRTPLARPCFASRPIPHPGRGRLSKEQSRSAGAGTQALNSAGLPDTPPTDSERASDLADQQRRSSAIDRPAQERGGTDPARGHDLLTAAPAGLRGTPARAPVRAARLEAARDRHRSGPVREPWISRLPARRGGSVLRLRGWLRRSGRPGLLGLCSPGAGWRGGLPGTPAPLP